MNNNFSPVKNLYQAPSNPLQGDCYYNITNDAYYIYDGQQWLTAIVQKKESQEETDDYILKYKKNGSDELMIEEFNNYDSLLTKVRALENAAYIDIQEKIIIPKDFAILIPCEGNLPTGTPALLKLCVVEDDEYIWYTVGEIYPKIIFNKKCLESIYN